MVTLDVLTSAPLTIEMLVARDISAYSERTTRTRGYSGSTGFDPAITGESVEER